MNSLNNVRKEPADPTPREKLGTPGWLRPLVLVLTVTALVLYVVAWFVPVWGFYLYAPQYPHGLLLSIRFNGISGDVTEINILNHYIGMARLDEAAKLERAVAGYGIGAIALAVLLTAVMRWRRFSWLLTLPAVIFPMVFLLLQFYWMYRFGHELSPEAPVRMKPFTPTLLGIGRIGNFRTYGLPGPAFYMITVSAVLAILVTILKWKWRRKDSQQRA